MKTPRRVVITGLGAVTAVGHGKDGLWNGILRGKSGVTRVTRFDASALRSQIAGEIRDFLPFDYFDPHRLKRVDRCAQMAMVATKMAVMDAQLPYDREKPNPDIGCAYGTALGGTPSAEADHQLFLKAGISAIKPSLAIQVFGGSGSSNIAIEFGLTGPSNANSNSCASGTMAVGEGFRYIRDGRARAMVCAAAEAPLTPLTFGAFDVIKAMSQRNDSPETACRPFDAERDGFVMGEGAAALMLEDWDHARARGATIYAEVLGYANNNDAFHMTAPRPDGSCCVRAMRDALAEARLSPKDIGYINAHASSTVLNDKTETAAIKAVFGEHAAHIPISGTKPFHAHALGASGAIEAVICALILQHEYLPPTLNLRTPDPECDLDYIPGRGRPCAVNYILSNSFGFGGINACVALGRWR
ncbi:MAG: beta-ketoacyl-[acyl-carrier-protein] synthase family protein [Verrucomicrobiae bacterium]|nr:beta-ketoacyl-[acyl-carrier-protein] synthase family protein [Verrucomicrobiae bacterium]